MFDEVAHAGTEHLDDDFVAAYDRKARTDWTDDVEALRTAGLTRESTVVDLGAGTGTFAAAVQPHVARVVGVDVSAPMVAAMRSRGIEAVQAGFLTYEHDAGAVDAVFSRNALHHLPDFWKVVAFERIALLLRPGGVFRLRDLVYSFEPANAATAIRAWLRDAPDDPATGWTAPELEEHVRSEYSTFSWLLEAMLERTGFEIRNRHFSPDAMYAAYTCVRSG